MDLTGMMVSIQSISIRFVSLTETKHLELSNQTFFDKHYFKFLPNKLLNDIHDTKKLLSACVEKVAECQIAPCPKCYSLFNLNGLTKPMKLKGVSLKKNSVESSDYSDAIEGSVKRCSNVNLQSIKNKMMKLTIEKNALAGKHTKMVCLPNQSCIPFIDGLSARNYYC